MDRLYTPWRMNYIRGDEKKPAVDCIFCAKANETDDMAELVVARSQFVYAALNLFPYNNGHLMIIPYVHVPSLEDLPTETLTDLMVTTNQALGALRQIYSPSAFNLGANLGQAAGAGIAAHFHMHIVPRWPGDTSFMSVVGNTRVIPDILEDTWRKLREAWPAK